MSIVNPKNNLGLADKVFSLHKEIEALRLRPNGGVDVSWKDHIEAKFTHNNGTPLKWEEFLNDLGVDLNRMTIENLISAPYDTRWLVPEVIREAIRLGLRRAPIHSDIVRSSETIEQPTQIMPYLNFSGEAQMDSTSEAETIGVGTVSYGSKSVTVAKKAKGIQYTYESIRFTPMNLASIFFEDVGVRLGHSLDAMAVNVLINGDVTGGAYSAPVLGVDNTSNKITYYDLTRMWVHGGMIGRSWATMIGNEGQILNVVNLTEYKTRQNPADPALKVNVHVPIVTNSDLYAHVNVPDTKMIMLDKAYGLVQLTAIPLMVESEKIVNRQVEGSYASIMTGFAKLFRDSAILLDGTVAFSGNGWPSWMTPTGFAS